jgi:hypothetical protein
MYDRKTAVGERGRAEQSPDEDPRPEDARIVPDIRLVIYRSNDRREPENYASMDFADKIAKASKEKKPKDGSKEFADNGIPCRER